LYMGINVGAFSEKYRTLSTPSTRAESYQVHLTLETPASLKGSKI
jgi:hypothetical protein